MGNKTRKIFSSRLNFFLDISYFILYTWTVAGDGGGERSACGRDPPKFFYFKIRSRCVLLVACCLWIYLASQEFSCLVPMLAKRGRRQLAVQDLRLRLGAAGPPGCLAGAFCSIKTLLTPTKLDQFYLISGPICATQRSLRLCTSVD